MHLSLFYIFKIKERTKSSCSSGLYLLLYRHWLYTRWMKIISSSCDRGFFRIRVTVPIFDGNASPASVLFTRSGKTFFDSPYKCTCYSSATVSFIIPGIIIVVSNIGIITVTAKMNERNRKRMQASPAGMLQRRNPRWHSELFFNRNIILEPRGKSPQTTRSARYSPLASRWAAQTSER